MKYLWYTFLGLFSLGFLGLVAGVIMAVGMVGFYAQDLPDYSQLADYEPAIVTRLYAGNGKLMNEFAREKRVFITINAVPDHVKHAFIAAEDQNFYSHPGIDIIAIARAAVTNIKNVITGNRGGLVGASTITQQVAKNFLLSNERTFERKIREAILAIRMESVLSKDQILELYLNEIYLGARSYGVAAAALNYFQKSLEELTVAEAAYLAALPKAPNNYHPIRKRKAAVARRNWVIDRMREEGYITVAQAELAKLEPLQTRNIDESSVVNSPYFGEEVRRILIDRYGEESLYGGGLAVRTTIDPELQDYAVESLRNGLMAYDKRHGYRGPYKHFESLDDWRKKLDELDAPQGLLREWSMAVVLSASAQQAEIGFAKGPKGTISLENMKWARESRNEGYARGPEITKATQVVEPGDVVLVEPVQGQENSYILRQIPLVQGALIALDPRNGRILAMQGGWKYGVFEQFNRATQAERQPGSAFKPFVYMAALDHGFTPATLVLDAPFVIEDRPGHFWKPSNYSGKYYGPTPIRVGVEKSKNLMTVRLADHLGMEVIADYAERFGVMEDLKPHLANALGAGETTLQQMTAAYAMIVNGGKQITPSFIDRIQDRYGQTIYRHDDRACENCGELIKWERQDTPEVPDTREQIVDPRTAYQMVSILEGVVQRGTGVRAKSLGRPLAGKTGTTNRSKDAWFMGFSPGLVVGVYTGFDDPRSLGKRETGSSVALPIFKSFMEKALEDRPIVPFRIPKGIRNVQINADTGARARIGDERVIWEAFKIGTEPTDEMYILDGTGINVMHSLEDYMGDEYGNFDPNMDPDTDPNADPNLNPDLYEAYEEEQEISPEDEYYRQFQRLEERLPSLRNRDKPQPRNNADTSGTGGLY